MNPQAARLRQPSRVGGIVAKALERDGVLDQPEVGGGESEFEAAESVAGAKGKKVSPTREDEVVCRGQIERAAQEIGRTGHVVVQLQCRGYRLADDDVAEIEVITGTRLCEVAQARQQIEIGIGKIIHLRLDQHAAAGAGRYIRHVRVVTGSGQRTQRRSRLVEDASRAGVQGDGKRSTGHRPLQRPLTGPPWCTKRIRDPARSAAGCR